MFTPSKPTGADLIDVTILNTPKPQASSTVQRKSTLESRFIAKDVKGERFKQPTVRSSDVPQRAEDSSLGILDNISSFLAEVSDMGDSDKQNEDKADMELEFARKLLQRCSDFRSTSIIYDTNKENNANIQNLTSTPSTLIEQGQSMYSNQASPPHGNTFQPHVNKTSSVVFEPNEISARSSGLSRSSEKSLTNSGEHSNVISFDTTTAELMAQFNSEEFRPASEMGSQLLADEVSWQQNYSYALPMENAAEKEYLNLSCFSGIIGELDLSVESCAGRKMSVDEFFRRKCGNIGELSDNAIGRPSLGLSVNSPKKKGSLIPLVDSTIMTEASSVASSAPKDKTHQIVPNLTKDIEEQSIMSLSSIAQALQDLDNGTPRRLVDQLIMAKKKKKSVQIQDGNVTRDTYTVSSSRKSMPATPTANLEKFENDMGLLNFSSKLSLDSKLPNETVEVKHTIPKMLSFNSEMGAKAALMNACKELKKETQSVSAASSYNRDLQSLLEDSQLSFTYSNTDKTLSAHTSQVCPQMNQSQKPVDLKSHEIDKNMIKQENLSYKDKSNSIISGNTTLYTQSPLNNVVIGRSTEELCNCIVGMSRETDIELLNKSDRWVICSLSLNQVQGEKQNVQLTLPKDVILIKPNAEQRAKIGVKIVKMIKPIIAVLNITVSDMVTRSEWVMKHIICFKPEEFNIHVSSLSQKGVFDFQCVVENSVTTLPLTIQNRNHISIPIKLSIIQDGSTIFNIDDSVTSKTITLKPQEEFTLNIQCRGVLSKNAETQQRRLDRYESRLAIQMENNVDDTITIKEIPLAVQVGTCNIQVIDTDMPLVVPNKQSKPMTLVNLGSVAVTVHALIVEDTDSAKVAKDFSVQPENLVLQPTETGCFFINYKSQTVEHSKKHVRTKLVVGNNVYHYSIIGESSNVTEENEHFLRCETPQYLSSISSPTSPHSVTSNRSGISGRNSPSSSVSGSTVAGEKIPIRATHAALVWNSVKTGKSEIMEFTIRNTSHNKIKIQAVISDNDKSFRFLRERQAVGSTIVLSLQRTESRTLSVVFSPHHIGAASGKIIFRHYDPKKEDNESRQSKAIFLYGYGGYGKVDISEAFKDISGKMWLSLGTLSSGGTLNAKIKLQNTGDLCSYAKIKLAPKAVYPSMVSNWHVNPTELLLNPKEIRWVTLEFRPRKEDLSLLQRSDVSHVGTVTVIHGDEPTRWRIRRLYNKMKETGELNGSGNEAFRNIVHPICKAFPGEQLIPDLNSIGDSVQNLAELCRGVRQYEIMLTMEVCADETLSVLHDNADDSQMFYSLCSDNSHVYEGNGESFLPSETLGGSDTFYHDIEDDNFIVSPSAVVLTPPITTEAIVTIRSSFLVAQPFETCLSNTEYLSVVPSEGMIPTRRGFQLKIQCKQKVERNFHAILEIYTENSKHEVKIAVRVKGL